MSKIFWGTDVEAIDEFFETDFEELYIDCQNQQGLTEKEVHEFILEF